MHLDELCERLHRYGPELGGDEEGNYGPTNRPDGETLRRGLELDVTRWLDRYVTRKVDLPAPCDPITDWRRVLGDRRRLPHWQAMFAAELTQRSSTDVLGTLWPRPLPRIAAGATHGVICVGHAV